MPRHWGGGLQLRLMRAAEAHGRRVGWHGIVSDTTDNLVSANNFIKVGHRHCEPRSPAPGRMRSMVERRFAKWGVT
ncbi:MULTISPECIES: hypothetical protein [Bradyrhizobium]|uniref:hypothetical protein n=1 Tax=Bradyrhizobium TaxID=374 RepID=UPI0030B82DC8